MLLDIIQRWLVEIAGTIIFIVSVFVFVANLLNISWVNIDISNTYIIIGIAIGLLLMGYKKLYLLLLKAVGG
jgi:hypothetical protein